MKKLTHMVLTWLTLLVAAGLANSQTAPVLLLNPSFEDEPWHSKPPRGWYFCGQPGETPPDVHPNGMFEVAHAPADGQTYVGMVVRDNGTWEGLGQHLEQPLVGGQCYRFSIRAARSMSYRSVSRLSGQQVHYAEPVRIRLWGGRHNCDRNELLATSDPVADTTWTAVSFVLRPQRTHHYFLIEAFYPTDTSRQARGNILLDDCSPLLPVDCVGAEPLVDCLPLPAAAPRDRQELDRLAARLAKGITFADGAAALRNQYFLNAKGQAVQENAALVQLVQALQAAPDVDLVIAVTAPGKQLLEQRVTLLNQRLRDLGLEPGRFRVHPFRGRDEKIDWLGSNPQRDVFVRLL